MDAFIESHNPVESSSTSEYSGDGAGYLEPEVMLASRNPKKRSGRKKFTETRHPVYRGVRRSSSGKWVCEVRQPNNNSRCGGLGRIPQLKWQPGYMMWRFWPCGGGRLV
ncbi:hypothetical protein L1987_76062 [Smallanthus sonchifolius]|uniref:Uncharacterized protein n=1 Tax=Smallanthus sonchifolius TaxID=185202 RepID=A0ACB9A7P8_9ASTR|nr:hypothetical protein L1987_76062 [Smallanthus sonchifolius]